MLKTFVRLCLSAVCFIATFYFMYWMVFTSLLTGHASNRISIAGSALSAVGVGAYTWRRSASMPEGLASSFVLGGVVVGGIFFVAGFFGPMIFAPQANQGPMLGLFITGPLGTIVGAIGGVAWWLTRGRARQRGPQKRTAVQQWS